MATPDAASIIGWMYTSMDKAFAGASDDRSVLDNSVVKLLTDRLEEAGRYLMRDDMPATAVDRADGFHYLLELLNIAADHGIGATDPYRPMFCRPWNAYLFDWGGASPDAVYRHTAIRGDTGYRIHGRLGNAKSMSLQFFAGNDIVDTITPEHLQPDAEGAFEIWVGGPERSSRWRPLHPEANMILTREFFDDWSGGRRAHLRIDCIENRNSMWPISTAERVRSEYDALGRWIVKGGFEFWAEREKANQATRPNAFTDGFLRTEGGLPALNPGSFSLAPGEALIVEFPDPEADFWAIQTTSYLWRTLDFANCLTTINCAQAHRDPDGAFRLVTSAEDPGVHNWLDTTGLSKGAFLFRVVRGKNLTKPVTRVARVADLAKELPNARRVAPDERRRQIAERREGISRLMLD